METRAVSALRKAVYVAFALMLGGTAVAADKSSARPIQVIVNFGPGGGADQLGRTLARLLEPQLGVGMPVVNISGASGATGLTQVAAAGSADGYTIGTMTGLTISAIAAGQGRLRVDDFTYLSVVQSSPSMLFVKKDSPFKTYKDLLEYAKAHPNKVRIATAGYGTLDDIAVKFITKKGSPVVNVPFAKPGERYASPLGGHTDALFEEPGDVAQFVQSGDLRPIVVFGSKRHPNFPDTPASAEFGQPIDLPNWRAVVVSAATPKDIADVLASHIQRVLQSKDWQDFCAKTYTCISPMSAADSRQFVQRNHDDVLAFLKEFGLMQAAAESAK